MMEAKTTGFHPAQLSINTAANQIQIRNQLSLRIAKVKGLAELNEAGEQSVLKKVKKKKRKRKRKKNHISNCIDCTWKLGRKILQRAQCLL